MKIFIVHASAGAGHTKAAEAVYNCFKEKYKDVEVKLVDILSETNCLFRFNYTWGYSYLVKHFPWLWHIAFWITANKALRFITRPIAKITNRINTNKFVRDLIRENPDFVISTHFLSSEISVYLKQAKKIKSKVITIITDFQVHPFWISEGTDIYVVASDFTKKILLTEKVPEEKIREFGIPIDAKFTKKYDKALLCDKLKVSVNKFTLLIVTGSFGIGPIEEIVERLYNDVQVLVVCARNKELFSRLENKNYPNVRAFGFIDNVHELMFVADAIITKPGGLSTSELLAMSLAPVFIAAIPGQEKGNLEAIKSYGIGIEAHNADEAAKIILDYKSHPDELDKIKIRINNIKKPFAAEELCDAICKGSFGVAG